VLSELDFVLERLSVRLSGGMRDWTELDGEVYWFFLHGKLNEPRDFEPEIDEEYASDAV
jgi:hypothetical protein